MKLTESSQWLHGPGVAANVGLISSGLSLELIWAKYNLWVDSVSHVRDIGGNKKITSLMTVHVSVVAESYISNGCYFKSDASRKLQRLFVPSVYFSLILWFCFFFCSIAIDDWTIGFRERLPMQLIQELRHFNHAKPTLKPVHCSTMAFCV